jgi:hypothetical protein
MVLAAMLLTGCGRPSARLTSEAKPYQPIPVLELTSLTNKDHVVAAYLRHSKGDVVLHLDRAGSSYGIEGREIYLDGSVHKPQKITFDSGKYEDFDCSLDVFHDGRIVLVPLQENSDDAIGAYVNLLSGKRYFFAPTATTPESMATLRTIARKFNVTIIVPEDPRAHERLVQFPEFRR